MPIEESFEILLVLINSHSIENNPIFTTLITAVISIIASIIAVFFTFDWTYNNNRKKHFKESYLRLKQEIDDNYNRSKQLTQEIERLTCLWEKKLKDPNYEIEGEEWIHPKYASFSYWTPYFTHYFPINEFHYFINQGFFNEFASELSQGTQEQIGYFYATCISFDRNSQDIDNKVHNCFNEFKNEDYLRDIKKYSAQIKKLSKNTENRINESYKKLNLN